MRSIFLMHERIVIAARRALPKSMGFAVAALVAGATLTQAVPALAAPKAAIIVDGKSGKVLYSDNPDGKRYPASLTKMMTLYLLFDSMESGRTSLKTPIKVSAHCAGQAPSKLGFRPGQTIDAESAILAIVTKSANDVACSIGEYLGGTESGFAKKMTARARTLGMTKTVFRNASGLPDPGQVTTARDMATLGRAIQEHFPEEYKYFSRRSFKWRGQTIVGHNYLLGRVDGVDGIKTGYTRASGFNLVTSVKRDNRYLVGVVLGGDSGKSRDARMTQLVKTYMPKASKGARTAPLIAGAPANDGSQLAAYAEVETPIPPKRPIAPEPITTASVVGANSIFALSAVEEGDTSDAENDAPANVDVETITSAVIASDKVTPRTQQMPPRVDIASLSNDEAVAAAAPAADIGGWKIQLGATPTEGSARDILERAQAKAPNALADASPYTETVVKENVTLYRARFAGFSGKDEARAACAQLTKQKFACLALSD
jgi:D-alanyl-D-alanine carboxypeptidase/D-alanyl-D-alanine carboxypeptidase (penicillin-binding protein 5/6)